MTTDKYHFRMERKGTHGKTHEKRMVAQEPRTDICRNHKEISDYPLMFPHVWSRSFMRQPPEVTSAIWQALADMGRQIAGK